MRLYINNTNSGLWSPLLKGRNDLEPYFNACQELRNMIPTKYGGCKNRTGLEYINGTKTNAKESVLIPFQFNTEQTYIIEVGDQYMRFYKNGAVLGAPYELSTSYLESELFDIRYAQINDVVYLAHENHPVRKLSRFSDTSWTITDVNFGEFAPMLDANTTSTTITPSGTSGSVTLTASSSIFASTHVGSVWNLTKIEPSKQTEIALTGNNTSSSLTVKGDWFVRTYGVWTATFKIQISDDNSTWRDVRTFTSSSDRNVDVTGSSDTLQYIRIVSSSYSTHSGTPRAVIEIPSFEYTTSYSITGYSSGTAVTATTLNLHLDTTATSDWAEGAFSANRGYPKVITFHEQRLVLANTTAEPSKIWFSSVNDFENFKYGTTDTSAFRYTIATKERNSITWISSSQELLVGTTGAEFKISSSSFASSITATDIGVKRQSSYGGSSVAPITANYTTLYVQRNNLKLMEMSLADDGYSYRSEDLTVFSENITGSGIKQLAYRQQKESILYAVTEDGELLGLTYDKTQRVYGWFKVETDGLVESVATIYGTEGNDDEVWVIVKRTVGGSTVRFVERLFQEQTELVNMNYLDSSILYSGSATTTITGLGHLEGKTVSILADGSVHPTRVVTSGQITLNRSVTKATVGLAYRSVYSPMPLVMNDNQGTGIGVKKRASKCIVKLLNSVGLKVGKSETSLDIVSFRDSSMAMDEPVPLFTGEKVVNTNLTEARELSIYLVQDDPLPITILGVVIKLENHDM